MKLADSHPIQCRCGRLRGEFLGGAKLTRITCYCRDCQAYARALGEPGKILDANGGTDVVASLQQYVRLTGEAGQLACLSLTDGGLLRWYASCCKTPIANTTRDPRLSYLGLMLNCLGRDVRSLNAVFGPPTLAINVKSASGSVPSSGWRTTAAMARIFGRVIRARLDGSWRRSPFFDSGGRPVANPSVVNRRPQ